MLYVSVRQCTLVMRLLVSCRAALGKLSELSGHHSCHLSGGNNNEYHSLLLNHSVIKGVNTWLRRELGAGLVTSKIPIIRDE